jgi:hypothetical protein
LTSHPYTFLALLQKTGLVYAEHPALYIAEVKGHV